MNKQNLIKTLCLIVISLTTLGLGCDKMRYPKSSIGVANNTNHSIEFYFALGGNDGILYPDTILPIGLKPPFQEVKAGEIGYRDFGFSEEKLFQQLPSDTLSIYLFHPDTLVKYSWQEVINDYKILKRYDLSLEDIKLLDFKVPYPPSSAMIDMKMYPPY